MKLITTIILITLAPWALYGQDANNVELKDTVIIEFGNNSKMVIYLKDKEDLESLLDYDINAMLEDLSMTIDSAEADTNYLVLEDDSGERYLSDTTIVVEEEDRNLEPEEEEINIKIGNIKLTGKIKDWDEYEEEVEDWEDGPNFKTTTYEEEHGKTQSHFEIDLGVNNFLENGNFPDDQDAPYSVKPWGSWYIA
ncbi:MAG: hypothetical protein ACR2MX_00620, partial [Cyclobacteriaceae bacterium]